MRKALTIIALLLIALPAHAQDLPAGPGREETLKGCSGCHGVGVLIGEHRSETLWSSTVSMMASIGAPISDADFDTVVTYLTAQFGPRPAPAATNPAPRR